jgi:hypothetical protein
MASFNTRFRLDKALAETGGSKVNVRMKERKRHTDPFGKLQDYLENPDFPGYFTFENIRRFEGGFWECVTCISDPDVAFNFKLKFG